VSLGIVSGHSGFYRKDLETALLSTRRTVSPPLPHIDGDGVRLQHHALEAVCGTSEVRWKEMKSKKSFNSLQQVAFKICNKFKEMK